MHEIDRWHADMLDTYETRQAMQETLSDDAERIAERMDSCYLIDLLTDSQMIEVASTLMQSDDVKAIRLARDYLIENLDTYSEDELTEFIENY